MLQLLMWLLHRPIIPSIPNKNGLRITVKPSVLRVPRVPLLPSPRLKPPSMSGKVRGKFCDAVGVGKPLNGI